MYVSVSGAVSFHPHHFLQFAEILPQIEKSSLLHKFITENVQILDNLQLERKRDRSQFVQTIRVSLLQNSIQETLTIAS